MNDFFKQKIVWGNLCLNAQYALVEEGYFINAPATMVVSSDKYILAILNSRLADYYIKNLGVSRSGGYFEYKPMFVEKLPIRDISESDKKPFNNCVSDILKANSNNLSIISAESRLNSLVYNLFGLSKEEVTFIEKQSCSLDLG